jgi:hypothetical protein
MKSPFQPSKEVPQIYKRALGAALLAVFGHQHLYLKPSPAIFIQSREGGFSEVELPLCGVPEVRLQDRT